MLEDMIDQFMANLNGFDRNWLRQKQAAQTMSYDQFSVGTFDGTHLEMNMPKPATFQPDCEPRTPTRHETANQWFEIQVGEYACKFSLKWRRNMRLLLAEFMGCYTFLATNVDNHHPGNSLNKISIISKNYFRTTVGTSG